MESTETNNQKSTETNNQKNAESNNQKNAESNNQKNAESNNRKNDESNNQKNADSNKLLTNLKYDELENETKREFLDSKFNEYLEKDPYNLIDSILFRSIYQEKKTLKLSMILNVIRQRLNNNVNSEGLAKYDIKLANGERINVFRKVINGELMFSNQSFLANYEYAFQRTLQSKTFTSKILPGLDLRVEIDLNNNNNANLRYDQIFDFKFFTCLFFGLWFHIELDECFCYPTTLKDWIAYNIGITKNCIYERCKVDLLTHPEMYDPFIHFDCTSDATSFTFSMINQLGNFNTVVLETKNTHLNKIELK